MRGGQIAPIHRDAGLGDQSQGGRLRGGGRLFVLLAGRRQSFEGAAEVSNARLAWRRRRVADERMIVRGNQMRIRDHLSAKWSLLPIERPTGCGRLEQRR